MQSVSEIINCKKEITRKRRPQFREEHRHYRMDIELRCEDENLKTAMFLRRGIDSIENFTVGLKLLMPNDIGYEIALLRFQGPHGGQSATLSGDDLHNKYHVHFYSEQDLIRRKKLASVSNKHVAEYNSFEEAIICFLSTCNISDTHDIFREERERSIQTHLRLNF